MIILLTSHEDVHAHLVQKRLATLGQRWRVVDVSRLHDSQNRASMTYDSNKSSHKNHSGREIYTLLETADKIWYRRPRPPHGESSNLLHAYQRDEFNSLIEGIVYSIDQSKIYPNYRSLQIYRNKTLQLGIAQQAGFTVPKTVIGNNPDAIKRVFSNDGDVLVKPIANTVIKGGGSDQRHFVIKTTLVPKADILAFPNRLINNPVIIQEYIPKKVELRVTVVGTKVFSVAIHSQKNPITKIDFRNNADSLRHEVYPLPESVSRSIRSYMKTTGLNFACFDIILTPDNKYVFLECNTNGQWLWIEDKTGLPISEAIAKALISRTE